MSYSSLTNQKDGVVAAAEDNMEPISGDTDVSEDSTYRQNIDPGSIKAGATSGYKGPGDTSLKVGDPRFA